MTLTEARALKGTIVGVPLGHMDERSFERAFDGRPPAERARYRQAMFVLLDEGTPAEQQDAVYFFEGHGFGEALATPLAELYVRQGWDSEHPLAESFGGLRSFIAEPQRAALRRLFAADPARHFRLATVALEDDRDGAAWSALASLVRGTSDVAVLEEAHSAADHSAALRALYPLLCDKPEPVLRALARRVSNGRGLLAACLMPPGPRLDRGAVAARLRTGKACLVEPTFASVREGDLYALFVEDGRIEAVHYDPSLGQLRRFESHPLEELDAVLEAVMGDALPEARLASRDARPAALFEAAARRSDRERDLRRRLGDGSCWFTATRPAMPYGTVAYLQHGPEGWSTVEIARGVFSGGGLIEARFLSRELDHLFALAPEKGPEPVPADRRRELDAAGRLLVTTLERLQAGAIAVRWGGPAEPGPSHARPDTPRVIAAVDGRLWELAEGEEPSRPFRPLEYNWGLWLRDALFASALRGDLAQRILPPPGAWST